MLFCRKHLNVQTNVELVATITLTAFMTIAIYTGSETAQAAGTNMTKNATAVGTNMTKNATAAGTNMTKNATAAGTNMTQP
jgi:hypothetical protein